MTGWPRNPFPFGPRVRFGNDSPQLRIPMLGGAEEWEGCVQRQTVERAIGGDHDAFAQLASASIASMYATARLIVRNDALAEDATQDALINAWRYLPSLRDPDRFEAWLYRLLINSCRTQFRANRRHLVLEIDVADGRTGVGDPGLSVADRDQLERGFHRLDADERAAVILR